MSYSFTVRAPSAMLALAAAVVELDRVIEQQPVHAADRAGAEDAVKGMLRSVALKPGEGEEVQVMVSGYVQWRGVMGDDANPAVVSAANVSVSAAIVAKVSDPAAPSVA